MPSETATSTVAIALTSIAVDPALFGQYVGAETVISKKRTADWLYVLWCSSAKTFSAFEKGVDALDAHHFPQRQGARKGDTLFLPVLGIDSQTTDRVLIGVVGCSFLDEIFDEKAGQFKPCVDVWRAHSAVDTSLIPGMHRLSRQLHVDFAINVHGGEGKRKRQPTRSIYRDTATMDQKPATKKKTLITKSRASSKDELIKTMQAEMAAKDALISELTAARPSS